MNHLSDSIAQTYEEKFLLEWNDLTSQKGRTLLKYALVTKLFSGQEKLETLLQEALNEEQKEIALYHPFLENLLGCLDCTGTKERLFLTKEAFLDPVELLILGIVSMIGMYQDLTEYAPLKKEITQFFYTLSYDFPLLSGMISEERYRTSEYSELSLLFCELVEGVVVSEPFSDSLSSLLRRYVTTFPIPLRKEKIEEKVDLGQYGLYLYEKNVRSLVTPKGKSLGSLSIQGELLALFGMQHAPLGNIDSFGVYKRGFDEKVWEGDKELAVWTRMVGKERTLSDLWIEARVSFQEALWNLSIKCENFGENIDPLLLFFAYGEEISVGSKKYHKGSLERYQGASKTVIVKKANQEFVLEPFDVKAMHVLPLAGDSHFWGASFLVAYEVHPLVVSKWHLSSHKSHSR